MHLFLGRAHVTVRSGDNKRIQYDPVKNTDGDYCVCPVDNVVGKEGENGIRLPYNCS